MFDIYIHVHIFFMCYQQAPLHPCKPVQLLWQHQKHSSLQQLPWQLSDCVSSPDWLCSLPLHESARQYVGSSLVLCPDLSLWVQRDHSWCQPCEWGREGRGREGKGGEGWGGKGREERRHGGKHMLKNVIGYELVYAILSRKLEI